jgi:hypothetical protein
MAALKKQRRKDMTEQEAKTKWCPMARCKIDHDCADTIAVNRWSDGAMIRGSLCVASDCMMWRWEVPEGKATNKNEEKWDSGYCGLAGKP